MKSIKLVLVYGFLIWLIPFVVAVLIFPIHETDRPLFESIMPVTVTLSVVVFSVLYFKRLGDRFLKEGILLGIIWFLMSIAIDLIMFSSGPMKMGTADYFKDIGLTYLIIPFITTGFGLLVQIKATKQISS
jgi:hypothetical protein